MKFIIPLAIIVCAAPVCAQNPLSVNVLDEAGQPIAGALVAVRVFTADDNIELAPQTADANGKTIFSMPNDKAGKPTAGAFMAGANGYSFGGAIGVSGPLAVPLEIRLERGQSWRGKIVDDKGAPLEGAQITIRGAVKDRDYASMLFLSDEKLGALYSAKSGADGTFEIPNLPTDRSLLYGVTRPKFARIQGQNASVGVVEVVKMKAAGSIKGRALDVAGEPLAKTKVYASAANHMDGGEGSPVLLRELLQTIDEGSGFAIRARAEAIPAVAQTHGLEAAVPFEDEMKGDRFYRNVWIPFAFYYARANPAGARLILEREWARSRQIKTGDDDLASIAISMAPANARRAAEMASELSGHWGLEAQIKIARYLVADEKTRNGFYLSRSGAREAWDEGTLQW